MKLVGKITPTVNLKHAETIHRMLYNPAVIPTEWFKITLETRINNFKARY
jgi:hypothetical protein